MAENHQPVIEDLNMASNALKRAIRTTLEEIEKDPRKEKIYLDLCFQHALKINRFFMLEAERTGNKRILRNIKRMIHSSMFDLLKFWR